jgi:hypothetical protein
MDARSTTNKAYYILMILSHMLVGCTHNIN